MQRFKSDAVAAKFESYPPRVRRRLLALRELVFQTARATPGVGELEETLKWGEPAYVPVNGAGSTVRLDWKSRQPEHYALYFHCQTNLVERFRTRFRDGLQFEGNRALVFRLDEDMPADVAGYCISAALTYHLKKRAVRRELQSSRARRASIGSRS